MLQIVRNPLQKTCSIWSKAGIYFARMAPRRKKGRENALDRYITGKQGRVGGNGFAGLAASAELGSRLSREVERCLVMAKKTQSEDSPAPGRHRASAIISH